MDQVSGLRCRYCRFTLFDTAEIFTEHSSERKTTIKSKNFALASQNCSHYFLDQDQILLKLPWLAEQIQVDGKSDGPILCGKCQHKLGSFSWKGSQCGCGAWQVPAIGIIKSKVDPIKQPLLL